MAKAAGSDTLCPLLGGSVVGACASCPATPACQLPTVTEYCYQRRFPRRCLDLSAQSCDQCTLAHEEAVLLNDTELGCFWCDGRIRACLPYFLVEFQLRLDEAVCAADLNADPIVPGLAGDVYYQNCTQSPKYETCQDRHCDCNNCTLDPSCFWCPGYNLCFDNITASLLACAFLGNDLIKTCDGCPPVALPASNTSDSAKCIGTGQSILTCPGLSGTYFEAGCLDLKAQSCDQCALAHVETVARNSSALGCFWCEGRIRACLPYYLPEVDLYLADSICTSQIGDFPPGLNGTAHNQTCTPKLYNTCQDRHCDCESCALDPLCNWCPGINLCFDLIPATPYACAFLGGTPISACSSCPNASTCSAPAPAPGTVTCGTAVTQPSVSSTPTSVANPPPAPPAPNSPPPATTTPSDACIDPGNRCDEGYLCINERCQLATTSYTTSGATRFSFL